MGYFALAVGLLFLFGGANGQASPRNDRLCSRFQLGFTA